MKRSYYIHQPEYWSEEDIDEIRTVLDANYSSDVKAARGEGAGGAGFDTVVEFVLPVASSVLASVIYDIVKLLVKRRPKKRPKAPEGVPSSYRLVIHTDDGILGINLDSDMQDIEIALSDVPDLSNDENASRAYQNGKHWDVF